MEADAGSVDWKALAAPVEPENVKWRIGSKMKDKPRGMALAYVDARWKMDRLNRVLGPGGWRNETRRDGNAWICRVSIKVGDEWVWREDAADESDIEGIKGGASDAFKRACVGFGLARELYEMDAPWVELTGMDKWAKIKPAELQRLKGMLATKAMASDATWDGAAGHGAQGEPATAPSGVHETPSQPSSQVLEWDLAIRGCECLDDLDDVGRQMAGAGLSDGDAEELRGIFRARREALMP